MTASSSSAVEAARRPVPWARVVLAGVLAGFASGLFGVGGGIVIVPALTLLAGFAPKLAMGTSLTAIVPIALAGAAGYATAGELDFAVAAPIAVGAVAGALIGTHWLRAISGPALQFVFAGFMVLIAVRLVLGEDVADADRVRLGLGSVAALILLGLASGLLAGLLGVGGGIVLVPALTIGFGIPLVLAKGTSLAVIVPTAIVGTVRNRSAGLTALGPGLAVGLAGIASALAASRLSTGLDPELSSHLFALLLVVVAVRLALAARAHRPSPEAVD